MCSIVAKHSHTLYINELCKEELYQNYGLANHKGYGTALHMQMLDLHGPIEGFHRKSYAPVQESMKKIRVKI